jgi:hypothetical protein
MQICKTYVFFLFSHVLQTGSRQMGPLLPHHGAFSGCGWRRRSSDGLIKRNANILSKQAQTAYKGLSSIFWFDRRIGKPFAVKARSLWKEIRSYLHTGDFQSYKSSYNCGVYKFVTTSDTKCTMFGPCWTPNVTCWVTEDIGPRHSSSG